MTSTSTATADSSQGRANSSNTIKGQSGSVQRVRIRCQISVLIASSYLPLLPSLLPSFSLFVFLLCHTYLSCDVQKPVAPTTKRAEFVWPPELPGPARAQRRIVVKSDFPVQPYDAEKARQEREEKEKSQKPRFDEDGQEMVKVVLKSKPEAR